MAGSLLALALLAAACGAPGTTAGGTGARPAPPATGVLTSPASRTLPPATGPSPPTNTLPPPTSPASAGGVPVFSHVFEVVMENLSYSSAMATPGFAALAHRYAWAASSYAAAHPSLPNYLALTAGSTFGTTSDCLSCFVSADNLGAQLSRAGISWGAYLQSVSGPCYLGTSYGVYAAKHNPFRYFTDIRSSPSLCSHLVPFTQLAPELAGPPSSVPRFVWVTPNVCDDGHSCPPSEAAAWLEQFVSQLTASPAWRQGGALFVTWDEGAFGDTRRATPQGTVSPTGGGGHVLTLVIAPSVPPGTVISTPLSSYALLATVERSLGLPLLGQAAAWSHQTFAAFFANRSAASGSS